MRADGGRGDKCCHTPGLQTEERLHWHLNENNPRDCVRTEMPRFIPLEEGRGGGGSLEPPRGTGQGPKKKSKKIGNGIFGIGASWRVSKVLCPPFDENSFSFFLPKNGQTPGP